MTDREIIEQALKFTKAFGDYLTALRALSTYDTEALYDLAHECIQGMTWTYTILSRGSVHAWQTDTNGVIQRCVAAKENLWQRIKKEREKEGK